LLFRLAKAIEFSNRLTELSNKVTQALWVCGVLWCFQDPRPAPSLACSDWPAQAWLSGNPVWCGGWSCLGDVSWAAHV